MKDDRERAEARVDELRDWRSHMIANVKVASRCYLLAFFHLAHGIIPVRWTSHEWWERQLEALLV